MKKMLVPIAVVLLFLGCDNEYIEDNQVVSQINEEGLPSDNNKSAALNAENQYPEVSFKRQKTKDKAEYSYEISVRDEAIMQYPKLEISLEFSKHGAPAGQTINKPIVITKELDKSTPVLRSEAVQFEVPVENTILDVVLTYISDNKVVETYAYSVFVFDSGSSALQRPRFIKYESTEEIFVSGSSVKIGDDPANEVASVLLRFNEPFEGPKPMNQEYKLENSAKNKKWYLNKDIVFSGNPAGFTYHICYEMELKSGAYKEKGASGEIGEAEMCVDFKVETNIPKIKNIRVREIISGNGGISYLVVATGENNDMNEVESIKLEFLEPFIGPKPTSSSLVLLRFRKRPEILYQAWDEAIQEYLSEIIENPLFINSAQEQINPLWNLKMGSPVGYTYTVLATMEKKNGKTVGEPTKFEVTVEGETKPEEIAAEVRIFSTDKGFSWIVEVKFEDKDAWVEQVSFEFIKPYLGAEPLTNPLDLTLTKEEPGNIKTYTFTNLKFKGDPTISEVPVVIVFHNGSGTKNATTKTSAKPQLL